MRANPYRKTEYLVIPYLVSICAPYHQLVFARRNVSKRSQSIGAGIIPPVVKTIQLIGILAVPSPYEVPGEETDRKEILIMPEHNAIAGDQNLRRPLFYGQFIKNNVRTIVPKINILLTEAIVATYSSEKE